MGAAVSETLRANATADFRPGVAAAAGQAETESRRMEEVERLQRLDRGRELQYASDMIDTKTWSNTRERNASAPFE